MIDKEDIWNWKTLSLFKNKLYKTLIYDYHVMSNQKKIEDEEYSVYKGFIAKREYSWIDEDGNKREEMVQYLISPRLKAKLPIRPVMTKCIELVDGKNVIYWVNPNQGYNSFRIEPKQDMTFRELVNTPKFEHTNQDDYFIMRLINRTALTHRIFVGIASKSNFGKDSDTNILDSLTGEMPSAEMGSIPAMLRDLNPNGAIIFNEIDSLTSDNKRVAGKLNMKGGARQTTFKNEKIGSGAHNTKDIYDITNMSILYLYNTLDQYKDKNNYFDNMFENKVGVVDRFLRLKLDGKMTSMFKETYDEKEALIQAEMIYKQTLRSIHYYRDNKNVGMHDYTAPIPMKDIKLSNRQKKSLECIFHELDRYCESQEEFNKYYLLILQKVNDYDNMVKGQIIIEDSGVFEEFVRD